MDYTFRFMRFKDGKAKALTLSYDDGVDQDIRLMKILDDNGIKCTFNISAGRFAKEGTTYPDDKICGRLMSKSQAINLYKNSGHEVAIHGYTHPHLTNIPTNHAMYEIIEDRKELEKTFDTLVRGCAYPFGAFNDDVVKILELAQIKYARTTISTNKFTMPSDWLRLDPTCHHKSAQLMELAEKFVELDPKGANLFYVWGHSYEFDQDNNWDVIENFAQYIGGREDIWYATNIEIYDYVEAYKNLQITANGKKVYNPSVIDVWMYAEGEVYKIPSGETVKL
ncbi:MAG: polysaccharide deacetylase family protein [Clostridia bacterium]|nr:polysaccharide deacetylase family protein [Clostridia bacterium]